MCVYLCLLRPSPPPPTPPTGPHHTPGFLLPSEYTKFVEEYTRSNSDLNLSKAARGGGSANDRTIWICKPSDSSRGRGVFLIRDLNELAYDQQYIAQVSFGWVGSYFRSSIFMVRPNSLRPAVHCAS